MKWNKFYYHHHLTDERTKVKRNQEKFQDHTNRCWWRQVLNSGNGTPGPKLLTTNEQIRFFFFKLQVLLWLKVNVLYVVEKLSKIQIAIIPTHPSIYTFFHYIHSGYHLSFYIDDCQIQTPRLSIKLKFYFSSCL